MESSIWVAVMTCFPAFTTFLISSFWIDGTSSAGISTPMSPRAIIMPSASAIMLSMFSTPCWFSIFAIILMSLPPFSSRIWRSCWTSSASRTKDAAIKSTPCSMPNRISDLSFSLRYGIDRCTSGTLMPLWLETTPSLSTRHRTSCSCVCSTRSSISPSSIRILVPACTSWYKSG